MLVYLPALIVKYTAFFTKVKTCYYKHMDFSFSFAWLFGGFAIIVAGVLILKFYKQIADNLLSGVSSYGRVKLSALITIGIGIAAMTNLVPLIMTLLVSVIFGGTRLK